MIDAFTPNVPPMYTGATTEPNSLTQGAGGKLGKQEFLHLLVTQLRYQDPMDPVKGQDMAAQLAQFSSVEQLVELNKSIVSQADSAAALLQATNSNVALGTIGREVFAIGDQVEVPASGAGDASVTFTVDANGGKATLKLLDRDGAVVSTSALGVVGGGRQTVNLGEVGADVPPGLYRYEIEVTDGETAVDVERYVKGVVNGVTYGSSGAVLTAGKLTIPIGQVISVTNPG
ncbi:MAG: flagellar hook assembly protein FlgD [Gemmatimonadaceae bacterium]